MAFKPTAEQQSALDAKGAVLVSAAAGSGKTAVLSNRVVKLVTDSDSPVDISDLLIVTFTNAAAEEMRGRISSLLGEAVEANPENYRLLRQKLSVDNAQIGTIDSFCMDLIRDNFVEAGVNPDFKIISNDSFSVLSKRLVNEAYIELSETDYDGYSRLLTALGCESADDKACKAVTDIYDHIRKLPMPERWLAEAEAMYADFDSFEGSAWFEPIISHIHSVADFNLASLNSVLELMYSDEKVTVAYESALTYLISMLNKIRNAAAARDFSRVSMLLSSYCPPTLAAVRGCDSISAKQLVKSAIDSARGSISKLCSQFCLQVEQLECDIKDAKQTVSTLIRLVHIYSEKMQTELNKMGMLDFAGIEQATLRLLCEEADGELRIKDSARHLCNRYKEVMVDEYQDTNDLQNAIFTALSGGGERLFLVGDVKQCIYRFRQANPNNFISLRETLPDYDSECYPSKIALSGNFRSRPEICDFVNFCFGLLMSKKACEIDYTKADRLDAKGCFADSEEDCVELHFVESSDISVQAEHIAAYIKQCVDRKMLVSEKGTLRPVQYGDFIVLLRSFAKYAPDFVKAMKKHSVPVTAQIKTQFFDRPEIMMIMSLLYAIDNPLRDVPLISAMMSPIIAFTADEMAQMRIQSRDTGIYAALLSFAKTNAKAREFLDRLTKYRLWADSMPIDRLICRIYDDTGLTAVVRAMDDGASRRANLLALAEYAAAYEQSGSYGIGAFLRHTDNVKRNNIELEGASVADGDNTVRVMTIHKSKGLESPVCIVAGLENPFNTADSRSTQLMHSKLGIGMRVCDASRAVRYDTMSRIAISLKENEASVAEEMRLLYVAMTRAKDKLVLVTGDKKLNEHLSAAAMSVSTGWSAVNEPIDAYPVKSATKMADWLYMCSLLHPSGAELRNRSQAELSPATAGCGVKVKFISSKTENADNVIAQADSKEFDFSPMLDYRYKYEKLLAVESKYSVSELSKGKYADSSVFKAKPAFITGDSMTAAEKGTATHRFMCYADLSRAANSVKAEADLLVKSGKLTCEQADGIDTDAINAFFADSIYQRLCNADRVLRESRFIFEVPACEIVPDSQSYEPVIVQGVADCVIFEADGIVIVDFKTDRNATEQELADKYKFQLYLYAKAFSSNYKMPVKQCYLYSFYLRKTVEILL